MIFDMKIIRSVLQLFLAHKKQTDQESNPGGRSMKSETKTIKLSLHPYSKNNAFIINLIAITQQRIALVDRNLEQEQIKK